MDQIQGASGAGAVKAPAPAHSQLHHIDRIIRETGKSFEDGSHIIYVNAQSQSDTPLGKLMWDFHCKQAKDMHYPPTTEPTQTELPEPTGEETMEETILTALRVYLELIKKEA